MSSNSVFFEGSVVEAIHNSRTEKKPLVVFLKGPGEHSQKVENWLLSTGAAVLKGCFVLRLEDDPADPDNPAYKNAKMFRQFFPTEELPAVMLMGSNGPAVASITGQMQENDLIDELKAGKAAYEAQVKEIEKKIAIDVQSASVLPGTIQALPPTTQSTSCINQTRARCNDADAHPKKPGLATVDDEQASLSSSMDVPVSFIQNETADPRIPPRQQDVKSLPVYDTTKLQFRLTNGELLRADFPSDATIKEVYSYLDIHRTDGCVPFTLETHYPKVTCGVEFYEKTLQQMDWVPRSTVLLKALSPSKASPHQAEAQTSGMGSIAGNIVKGVGNALVNINPLNYLWGGSTREQSGSNQRSMEQEMGDSETQHISENSSGIRRRSNYNNQVHGLHDSAKPAEDDSNTFWNGNSTQYGGHED